MEYCRVATYLYRDAATVPEYTNQSFPESGGENGVYRITQPLPKLPAVPQGHRLMILNKKTAPIWDSQVEAKYKESKEGFIVFI